MPLAVPALTLAGTDVVANSPGLRRGSSSWRRAVADEGSYAIKVISQRCDDEIADTVVPAEVFFHVMTLATDWLDALLTCRRGWAGSDEAEVSQWSVRLSFS
jgi:hypothetical protein